MTSERQVKIVKRVERERREQEAAIGGGVNQSPQEVRRDLVATVTEWVDEFRRARGQQPPSPRAQEASGIRR